jgi:hypothetical protein
MKEGEMEIVWVIVTIIALAIAFVWALRFGERKRPSDLAPDPQGYGVDLQSRRRTYERLGNVLYWIGCIIAALIVGVATALYVKSARSDDLPTAGFLILIATIVWTIGRACRYVLAGM